MFKKVVFALSLAASGLLVQVASAGPIPAVIASGSDEPIQLAQYWGPPADPWGYDAPPRYGRRYDRPRRYYDRRYYDRPRYSYDQRQYRRGYGYGAQPYGPRRGTVIPYPPFNPRYNAPHEYTPQPFSR